MSTHVEEQLLALIERRLPPAERARVLRHLAACANCSASAARLAESVEGLTALPRALRSLPGPAAKPWPAVWARVQAAGPARKLWPHVSIYLSVVSSFVAFLAVMPGLNHGAPASITAGVALGPQGTQAVTVMAQAEHTAYAGTTADWPQALAAPAADGTRAFAPVPVPTPVPGP